MDNFDLKKYLVENKVTTNSRMINENEEDFSVELLVPKIYFNVETGELAETPAAFGARSELKNMDITNYSDEEELIEWVFDGSLEKAKYFEKEYPGLFKVIGGSKMMNEVEGPESITIKFWGDGFIHQYYKVEGKKIYQADGFRSNLRNLEGKGLDMKEGSYYPLFKILDGENKPGRPSKTNYWLYLRYIGNTVSIIRSNEHYDKGIDIDDNFDSLNMADLITHCTFDQGMTPGAVDDRKYFEIVSVR